MNVFRVTRRNQAITRVTRLAVTLTVLLLGMSVVFGIEVGTPNPPALPNAPIQPDSPSQPNPPGKPQTILEPANPTVDTGMNTYAPVLPYPDAAATTPLDGSGKPSPHCDPFVGLYGQHVLVHLENDSVISGIMIQACQGFITLEQFQAGRTLVVNIPKILYLELIDA